MTITVTSVANTQSFGAWLSTTNRLTEIISQNTVTVDTSTGGSISTGNGYVNGHFGANYLYVANGLSGGNVSSNGVLDIVSNVAFKYSTSNLVTLTANSTVSVLTIAVTNVNITANSISIIGNTTFANAVVFSNSVTWSSTTPPVFNSNVTVNTAITVGNTTVNAVINSTSLALSNSTVSYALVAPTAAQYSANDYYLNANGQWSQVTQVSAGGSNTFVQFNDSGVFGGNAGLTFNKLSNTLTVGTATINSTVVNATSYIIGTSLVTNTAGVYTTGTVNGATISVGTSTIANATGVYTGTINAASYTVGTSFIANTTTLYHIGPIYSNNLYLQGDGIDAYIRATTGVLYLGAGGTNYFAVTEAGGGSFIPTTDNLYNLGSSTNRFANIYTTGTINAASFTVGTSTIANATGVYTTGTVNGATISVGTSTIANSTGVYTGIVNGASHTVGTSTIANATGVYTTGTVNGASHTVGTSTIANATGVYTTGTVNGSTLSVGTSVTANSTRLVIGTAVGLQANGGIGTANQALFSNGTSVYWANVVGGATITANNTDTQTFYIPMSNATSGSWSNGVVSNTKLYFVPSTGTLNATIFNSLSDREQKVNIVTAPIGFIDLIRGVEYDWKDTGKKSSGVIAQEIEEYLPHLVETKDGSKSVNYSGLIAYLIEEIKQLKDRVKTLENK